MTLLAEPVLSETMRVLFHLHLKLLSSRTRRVVPHNDDGPRRVLFAGLRCKVQYFIFGLGGFRGPTSLAESFC